MYTQITTHGSNPMFGEDAGWIVWKTTSHFVQLTCSQAQNINALLSRDMAHLGDEHYVQSKTKIRIVGAARHIPEDLFLTLFLPVLLSVKTPEEFKQYVELEAPDSTILHNDLNAKLEMNLRRVQNLFPSEKLAATG